MAVMLDQEAGPYWDALPIDVCKVVVKQLCESRPVWQAQRDLAALRRVSRHWRQALDEGLEHYAGCQRAEVADGPHPLCAWRNLRSLELAGSALGDAFFSSLARCSLLTSLRLSQPSGRDARLGPQQLRALASLSATLRQLAFLDCCFASPSSLGPLAGCTQLETFTLHLHRAADLTDAVAALVRGWPRLRRLDLGHCIRLSSGSTRHPVDLGGCTQLTSLRLRNTLLENEGWAQLLTGLQGGLQELAIRDGRRLGNDGFERAAHALAGSLTSLELRGMNRLTSVGFSALGQLTSLQSLAIAWCPMLADRSLLPLIARNLSQLTHLDLTGCEWTNLPLSFDHLTNLRQLHSLAAAHCGLTATNCLTLGRLPSLQRLDLSENPALGSGASLAPLAQLTALTELCLHCCQPGDYSFISCLGSLQRLHLRPSTDSTPAGWPSSVLAAAAGAAAGSLRRLQLLDCVVDGDCLQQLARLTALEVLDLSLCREVLGETSAAQTMRDKMAAAAAAALAARAAGAEARAPAAGAARGCEAAAAPAPAGPAGSEQFWLDEDVERLGALVHRLPRLHTLVLAPNVVTKDWEQSSCPMPRWYSLRTGDLPGLAVGFVPGCKEAEAKSE